MQENKQDKHRDQRYGRRRHHEGIVGRILGIEQPQHQLQGPLVSGGQVDARPHEVVPLEHEGCNRQRRDSGLGQGHHDADPYARFVQAVDARRFQQLVGNAHIELAHHEHTEGRERVHDHDAGEAVGEPPARHHHVLRHHVDLPGYGDRGHVGKEQKIPALELEFGKRVGRKARGCDLQYHGADGEDRRILKAYEHRHPFPDLCVVLPAGNRGNPLDRESENVLLCFQRGGNHPQKRHQHQYAATYQQHVQHDFTYDL